MAVKEGLRANLLAEGKTRSKWLALAALTLLTLAGGLLVPRAVINVAKFNPPASICFGDANASRRAGIPLCFALTLPTPPKSL